MLRRIAISLMLLGGLACATPSVAPLGAGPIVPGPDERVNVSHVYVVIDASSSVEEAFPTEKALVQSFVGAMPDGTYEVAAIAFGGYKRQTAGLNRFDRASLKTGAVFERFGGLKRGVDPLEDRQTNVQAGQHSLLLRHQVGAARCLCRYQDLGRRVAQRQVLGQRAVDQRLGLGRHVEHTRLSSAPAPKKLFRPSPWHPDRSLSP